MKCILGLDISTSITGATILSETGDILYCESWDTRNKKHFPTLFHKAEFIKNKLKDLHVDYNIHKVFIEENLQSFRSGFSSAKTISTLAKMNGIVSYTVFSELGIEPEYLAATSARKLSGITVPRGTKAKQKVLEHILDNEKSFLIFYTKQGNPVPGTYDRADSLVIAKAGLEVWKQTKSDSES